MGRDIRIEFLDGGEGAHALYLLDSMEAGEDFNGWDINTAAFDWYNGSGHFGCHARRWQVELLQRLVRTGDGQRHDLHLQVGNVPDAGAARVVGGQQERPVDRQRRRGLVDGRLLRVGAGAYHPAQFIYAGSLSGFLNLSAGPWPGLVRIAMQWNGGFNPDAMWGPPSDPAWARNDPTVNVGRLVANGTRIWIYCGNGTPTDPSPREPGCADRRDSGSWKALRSSPTETSSHAYVAAGGNNGVFNFPDGIHSWGYWGQQLQQMKPDIQRVLGASAHRLITTTVPAVRVSAPCRNCSSATRRRTRNAWAA